MSEQEQRYLLGIVAYNMVRSFKTLELSTRDVYSYLCEIRGIAP